MKLKGVTVDMKEIFQDGPYLVFRLRVVHVNSVMLAEEFTAMSGFVKWFISSMGENFQKVIEEEYRK